MDDPKRSHIKRKFLEDGGIDEWITGNQQADKLAVNHHHEVRCRDAKVGRRLRRPQRLIPGAGTTVRLDGDWREAGRATRADLPLLAGARGLGRREARSSRGRWTAQTPLRVLH